MPTPPRKGPGSLDFALLRGAIEETPIGVATMRAGSILYANGTLERLLGADQGRLEGVPVASLFDEPSFARMNDELERRRTFDGRVWCRAVDGLLMQAEVHAERYTSESAGVGGFMIVKGIGLEVDALQRLLDHVGGVLLRVRLADLALEFVSPAIEKLVGIEASACMEHPGRLVRLLGTEDLDRLNALERSIARGEQVLGTAEVQLCREDGAVRTLAVHATGWRDSAGVVRHLDGVVIDVTPRGASGGTSAGRTGTGASATPPGGSGVLELSKELIREAAQRVTLAAREASRVEEMLLGLEAVAAPVRDELRSSIETLRRSAEGATALGRRVRRALESRQAPGAVFEILESVRQTLGPILGPDTLVIQPGNAARAVLETRVEELTLALVYLVLRVYRTIGAGIVRLEVQRRDVGVSRPMITFEIAGEAQGTPADATSASVRPSDVQRADEATRALVEELGGIIDDDQVGVAFARTVVRLPC